MLLLLACASPFVPGRVTLREAADTAVPEWTAGDLTIEVNAEVATLLDARWTLPAEMDATWLVFRDPDGAWATSPPMAGTAGAHEEVLIGLAAEQDTVVRVMGSSGGDSFVLAEAAARTGSLPEPRLQPFLVADDPAARSPERWILGAVEINDADYYWGGFWVFLADRQGRIVWYHAVDEKSWTLFPRPSRDGTHVVFEHARVLDFGGELTPSVERRTLSGRRVEDTQTPGLGFTFDELPDGSLLFDDYSAWPSVTLTEQAPGGERRVVWDCTAWAGDRCTGNFCCSANAVVWRDATDTVLWSMWESDAVVEVERATGAVLHTWGALEGAWAFDPPEAGFDKQHWPNYTGAGTLLVSTHTLDGSEQRFREYALDEDAGALRQIWEFGEGEDLFAIHHGEAVRLANGNTLVNYGTEGVIRELLPTGAVAWELAWEEPFMLGHNALVDDLYALDGREPLP